MECWVWTRVRSILKGKSSKVAAAMRRAATVAGLSKDTRKPVDACAQGRAEERALLCRQAERKFDAATARRLAAALEDVADAGRLAEVGDWIIECGTAAELLARVSDERRRGV